MKRGRAWNLWFDWRIGRNKCSWTKTFPQLLRKSLWKSLLTVLQSCYSLTLRTFCTRQRHAEKAFHKNRLSYFNGCHVCSCVVQPNKFPSCESFLIYGREVCLSTSRYWSQKDCSTNSGTKRNQSKVIAPTDGEQFLNLDRSGILLRIQLVWKWVSRWFWSEREHEEESEVIIYLHLCELFAFKKYAIGNAIFTTKILLRNASWKFRKRSCKKSFDHYNAIPSLNDWLPRLVLISDLIFDLTEG